MQCGDAVAQLKASEAQPLLLVLQVDLLSLQLVLELPGEVVEEVVPAHACDGSQHHRRVRPGSPQFRTSSRQ